MCVGVDPFIASFVEPPPPDSETEKIREREREREREEKEKGRRGIGARDRCSQEHTMERGVPGCCAQGHPKERKR